MADKVITAQARLTAVDATGNAFGAVTGKINRLSEAAKRMTPMALGMQAVAAKADQIGKSLSGLGRNMSVAVTAPTTLASRSAYRTTLEFQKELNKAQALGELTQAERNRVEKHARELGKTTQFTASQSLQMIRTFIQAGQSVDQAIGSTKPALDFALFGDVDPKEAASIITSVASAYRLPMQDLAQSQAAAGKVSDIIAKAANISRADVGDLAQGFKYAAPLASKLGVSMEQLAAAIAAMNQNGLRGDEAGIAMRSMLTRMVKPTLDARQAMAELGASFEDFSTKFKSVDTGDFMSGIAQQGLLKGDDVGKRGAALKAALDKALAGKTLEADRGEVINALRDTVIEQLGVTTVQDKNKVAKMVNRYVSSLSEAIDVDKLLAFLSEKGATAGQIARIFDQKQGGRLATIVGGQYEEYLKILSSQAVGASARGAALMEQGLYGADKRFRSAVENFTLSLASSGVIDTVTNTLNSMTKAINSLSETNPKTLELATYAAMATAAIGPLALALGGLSKVVGFMLAIPGVAALAGGGAAAAGGAAASGGAAAAGSTATGALIGAGASRIGMASRFGLYGLAAYGGYQIGQTAVAVGEVAGGKYYTPKDQEEIAQLTADLASLEARIAGIRGKSRNADMAETIVAPLVSEAQTIKNRIGAYQKQYENLPAIGKPFGSTPALSFTIPQTPQPAQIPVLPTSQAGAQPTVGAFPPIGDGRQVKATVEHPVPVDVTGKVGLDPASKVDVNVRVQVQGQATLTGQSVTASGNARGSASTGTTGAGSYDDGGYP